MRKTVLAVMNRPKSFPRTRRGVVLRAANPNLNDCQWQSYNNFLLTARWRQADRRAIDNRPYRILSAMLLPGVWKSTPSRSVTVAAIWAKLSRVPRFPGRTALPSTSRGTYSLVWSVVAV